MQPHTLNLKFSPQKHINVYGRRSYDFKVTLNFNIFIHVNLNYYDVTTTISISFVNDIYQHI